MLTTPFALQSPTQEASADVGVELGDGLWVGDAVGVEVALGTVVAVSVGVFVGGTV